MFPVTNTYIISPYIDKNTNNEVTVSPNTEKNVISSAENVLKLSQRNIPLLYADVKKIYNLLVIELEQEKYHACAADINKPVSDNTVAVNKEKSE